MNPSSASGVSTTRSAPNLSRNPSVTLNAPPYLPISSPMRNTDWSASISSQIPREIACRKVSSGISFPPGRELDDPVILKHAPQGILPWRRRGRHGELDGVFDRRLQPILDGCFFLPGQPKLLFEPSDRVLLLPLLEQLGWDIRRVVVHRMTAHAQRLEL